MYFKRIKNYILSSIRKHCRDRYIARLEYAIKSLRDPEQFGVMEHNRKYTLEAVEWLYLHYTGHSNYYTTPENKLTELLAVPAGKLSRREHVYSRVLHSWIKNKQIEGF